MNRDYLEEDIKPTFWEKVGMIAVSMAFLALFWFCAAVGSAYEDPVRCLNGYEEVCIPEDFK